MDQRPDESPTTTDPVQAHWFREPTVREHWIAAALFVGFGLFFIILFWIQRSFWFRWVILGLAAVSGAYALRHAAAARRPGRSS